MNEEAAVLSALLRTNIIISYHNIVGLLAVRLITMANAFACYSVRKYFDQCYYFINVLSTHSPLIDTRRFQVDQFIGLGQDRDFRGRTVFCKTSQV